MDSCAYSRACWDCQRMVQAFGGLCGAMVVALSYAEGAMPSPCSLSSVRTLDSAIISPAFAMKLAFIVHCSP